MQRILLEGPALEPVSLDEAKAHLRLDGDDENNLVGALIAAARVAVETEIRRVLIAQSWRAAFDHWPAPGIMLPVGPLIDVEAVRAFDRSGTATTLGEADYEVRSAEGAVLLFRHVPEAARYEIDFTAGYGASGLDVPQPLRQAVRMLVAHWYENRGAVVMGETWTATPFGYREMVAPYRRLQLC